MRRRMEATHLESELFELDVQSDRIFFHDCDVPCEPVLIFDLRGQTHGVLAWVL
jgi:hypothetical protein